MRDSQLIEYIGVMVCKNRNTEVIAEDALKHLSRNSARCAEMVASMRFQATLFHGRKNNVLKHLISMASHIRPFLAYRTDHKTSTKRLSRFGHILSLHDGASL